MKSSAFSLSGEHAHIVCDYSAFVSIIQPICLRWMLPLEVAQQDVGEAQQPTWFRALTHVRFVVAARKV